MVSSYVVVDETLIARESDIMECTYVEMQGGQKKRNVSFRVTFLSRAKKIG